MNPFYNVRFREEATFAMSRRLISSNSPFESQIGFSRAVVSGPYVFELGTTGYTPFFFLLAHT